MTPADWVLAAGLAFSLGLSGWLWRRGRRLERRVDQRLPAVRLAPPASALQHVGLVRFRAFHDVGGDHSFALALLDGTWTLTARPAVNTPSGPPVRIQVTPGGSLTVDLRITLG